MMLAIFLTMLAALGLGVLGRALPARLAAGLCLALTIWLFLWEVWSPETGFRMPWIDTWLILPQPGATA